ncbi:hemerythrin domain-containing protein [Naumannella huperziae]
MRFVLPPCLRLESYEDQRPTGPDTLEAPVTSRLTDVHDHFRRLVEDIHTLLDNGEDDLDLRPVRARLTALSCRRYCVDLVSHHVREDSDIFPALAAMRPELATVLTRLSAEHDDMHQAIRLAYDRTLSVATAADRDELRILVHALAEIVESHFRYEEHELGHAMNAAHR